MAAVAFEGHAQNAKKTCPILRALLVSIFFCGPSSCEFQRPDIVCAYILFRRTNPVITAE
jgi:hypothetical protein